MAEPLGQVVFKVPELGKMGYQLELQDQAREEKKRKERDTELYRTGGEKAYSDNIYKIKGRHKDDIQLLFQEYEKYGQTYEATGDPSALRQSKELSAQIKKKIDDYNTQIGVPLNEAFKADASGWEGYVGNRDEFDANINNVLNPKDITGRKYENGNLLYQINGEWVPESATPYGDSRPNANNTVFVRKATTLGSYVVPSYFENQHRYTSLNASSASAASAGLKKEFYFELDSNPELRADAAVAYAISKGLLPSDKIDPVEMRKAIERYNNPNAPALGEDEGTFAEAANNFYADKLGVLAENRYSTSAGSKSETLDDLVPTSENQEAGSTVSSLVPDIKFENTPTTKEKQAGGEAEIDDINKKKVQRPVEETTTGGNKVIGPPTPEEAVSKNVTGMEDIKFDEVPEEDETPFEKIPASGVSDTQLTIKVDGKEDIVMERTLPSYYTDNLLLFEGGVSTDEGDLAAGPDRNKNAPIVDGKKAHTNRGVTYDKFESWAKSIGLPKSKYKERFLNLTEADALAVAEAEAVKIGANNFKEPALSALFTQNTWGGGSPFITPSFKNSFSDEYKAVSVFLNKNGIKLSSPSKISPKEASQIDALYRKNPEKFINDFFDAWMISHTRMAAKVPDNENVMKLGKGALVPTWMINRNGWYNRANDLKKSLAEQAGVKYTPVSPYNKTRKYIKSGDNFVLVEERDGKWVNVGKTDWFDSYQQIK